MKSLTSKRLSEYKVTGNERETKRYGKGLHRLFRDHMGNIEGIKQNG